MYEQPSFGMSVEKAKNKVLQHYVTLKQEKKEPITILENKNVAKLLKDNEIDPNNNINRLIVQNIQLGDCYKTDSYSLQKMFGDTYGIIYSEFPFLTYMYSIDGQLGIFTICIPDNKEPKKYYYEYGYTYPQKELVLIKLLSSSKKENFSFLFLEGKLINSNDLEKEVSNE